MPDSSCATLRRPPARKPPSGGQVATSAPADEQRCLICGQVAASSLSVCDRCQPAVDEGDGPRGPHRVRCDVYDERTYERTDRRQRSRWIDQLRGYDGDD